MPTLLPTLACMLQLGMEQNIINWDASEGGRTVPALRHPSAPQCNRGLPMGLCAMVSDAVSCRKCRAQLCNRRLGLQACCTWTERCSPHFDALSPTLPLPVFVCSWAWSKMPTTGMYHWAEYQFLLCSHHQCQQQQCIPPLPSQSVACHWGFVQW